MAEVSIGNCTHLMMMKWASPAVGHCTCWDRGGMVWVCVEIGAVGGILSCSS